MNMQGLRSHKNKNFPIWITRANLVPKKHFAIEYSSTILIFVLNRSGNVVLAEVHEHFLNRSLDFQLFRRFVTEPLSHLS
jgi:hypothetical protein